MARYTLHRRSYVKHTTIRVLRACENYTSLQLLCKNPTIAMFIQQVTLLGKSRHSEIYTLCVYHTLVRFIHVQ